MNTLVASITIVAGCGVLGVAAVPGFAQTNTSVAPYATLSTQGAAQVYVASRSAAYEHVELAANLTVTSLFQTVVEQMLQRSPTFRRQCARIAAAPHLTIEVVAAARQVRRTAAWTSISRTPTGHIHASITVSAVGRTAELIAHELEHVIEQLDGINLNQLVRVRSSGVRHCECETFDAYETTRAIRTGLRVAEEMGERGF
jgi:hypothetical protein